MFRIQDLGEVGYGGVVTLAGWWDGKRIAAATLTNKQIFKKAGFWAYWGIGIFACLNSQFRWFRNYETWTEHISHGFLYDLPRQVYNLMQSQQTTPAYVAGDAAAALREAKEIIRQSQMQQAAKSNRAGYEVVAPSQILV